MKKFMCSLVKFVVSFIYYKKLTVCLHLVLSAFYLPFLFLHFTKVYNDAYCKSKIKLDCMNDL